MPFPRSAAVRNREMYQKEDSTGENPATQSAMAPLYLLAGPGPGQFPFASLDLKSSMLHSTAVTLHYLSLLLN